MDELDDFDLSTGNDNAPLAENLEGSNGFTGKKTRSLFLQSHSHFQAHVHFYKSAFLTCGCLIELFQTEEGRGEEPRVVNPKVKVCGR